MGGKLFSVIPDTLRAKFNTQMHSIRALRVYMRKILTRFHSNSGNEKGPWDIFCGWQFLCLKWEQKCAFVFSLACLRPYQVSARKLKKQFSPKTKAFDAFDEIFTLCRLHLFR
jgi:hypothetical protein